VYGLSEYDATWITEDKFIAGYFEQITGHTDNFKAAANWITGPVKAWMNESHATIEEFPLSAQKIAGLIALVDHNKISFSNASGRLFKALLNAPDEDPEALAAKLQLFQEGDESLIESWVEEVMKKMPDKVAAYKKGKKGLMGLFVAEVKKLSKGKADLKLTTTILEKKLES
jgi:aspartyl-tRNA(Asn)/glutamyl-tRNA(Gln) amidotransferase subunit B